MAQSFVERCLHAPASSSRWFPLLRVGRGARSLRPWSSLSLLGALFGVLVAAGCTTVPTQEFATYKETFAKARAAGEEVVLDYGAAAVQYEEIKAKRAAAKAAPRARSKSFDQSAVDKNAASVNAVLVRMKAWEVVARYNDLLTALAEGRAADELAGAVDGLSASLTSFPIATVAATASSVTAYLAPLKPLALEAVREQSRRQFIAAVGKGAPLITDNFLKLLREDVKNYYEVRYGLNDLEISALADAAFETEKLLAGLLAQLQASPEIDKQITELNDAIKLLPVRPGETLTPLVPTLPARRGSAALTPEAKAQINSLIMEAKDRIAKVAAKDDELNAYTKVLGAYVALLNQLEHSMRGLQMAAELAQPGIPPSEDLERIIVLLREAYIAYKDKGGG